MCNAMKKPELKEDPRFSKVRFRAKNIDLVDKIVTDWTSGLEKKEIFRIAQEHGVICAPVQTIPETIEDQHMLKRGSLEKKKVDLVKVEANSDTQSVLKQLVKALEKQGFKVTKKKSAFK